MVCAGESCKPVKVKGSWDLAPSHMRSSLNFKAILNMSDVSRAGLEVSFSLDTFTNGFFHARLTVLHHSEAAVY